MGLWPRVPYVLPRRFLRMPGPRGTGKCRIPGCFRAPRYQKVMFRPGSRGEGCSRPATLLLNLILASPHIWTKLPSSNRLTTAHHARHSDSVLTDLDWGWGMKFIPGVLAAVLLLAGMGASHAVVRIGEDRGGRIGPYVDRYQEVRSSGEMVIIDGLCASACTIVLGAIPRDKICVTSHATLGFHAAWDFGANGRAITNQEATQMLYSMYPSPVKGWLAARGGLTPHMIFLRGKELQALFKPCYLDAQASSPRMPLGAQASAIRTPLPR